MSAPASSVDPHLPHAADRPACYGGAPLFAEPLPMVRPALPPAGKVLVDFRTLLETGQLTNGRFVRRFEEEAAHMLGVPECVAVSSCTSGLLLVERCLGLAGRVIVPSFTFFATAHSLLWNRLEPVLADSDPATWNLDPQRVRQLLERPGGRRISAILAVHIFGNPAAVSELEALAERFGVRLIFDAAHAFGAHRQGRPVGGAGDAEVFSLSPTKTLVAGEGGLISTRRPELAASLRAARNYGHDGEYDCAVLGLNARMTEFQAALALAGLAEVEAGVQRRRHLASIYEYYLAKEPGLTLQQSDPRDRATRKDFSIVIDPARFGVSRDFLCRALEQENVAVRRYFDPPLHRQRLYRRYYRPALDPLTQAERLSRGVLSLPIYPLLGDRDAEIIARRILTIRDWASGRGVQAHPPQREAPADPVVEARSRAPHDPQPADAFPRPWPEA
jgi:dTDP-4-amino-4,6-dideoxygalactose transaminase